MSYFLLKIKQRAKKDYSGITSADTFFFYSKSSEEQKNKKKKAFISSEIDYATTIFKLQELKILPYLSITFGSRSLSFAVAELFLRLLQYISTKH